MSIYSIPSHHYPPLFSENNYLNSISPTMKFKFIMLSSWVFLMILCLTPIKGVYSYMCCGFPVADRNWIQRLKTSWNFWARRSLRGNQIQPPHFSNEETKLQRSQVTDPTHQLWNPSLPPDPPGCWPLLKLSHGNLKSQPKERERIVRVNRRLSYLPVLNVYV